MMDDTTVEEFLSQQILVERELGKRSFYDFYRMAWPTMDAAPFVPGRHIRVICYHLQLLARRDMRQLVILIPPRHSKSLLCSVAFPAWVWTFWPSAKFITASYDLRLAARDSRACRSLIESPWYRERWPEVRLERDQNQKMHYITTAGGTRFVCSPNSGATGHGSDFNIFDDPHNVTEGESDADRLAAHTFWFESMSSRFNSPERGCSLVVQQRVHHQDVGGECIRRGYYSVCLPARFEPDHPDRHVHDWRKEPNQVLWPEKFGDGVLKLLWKNLGGDGSYAVAGQQQQRPRPREGGFFKQHWFRMMEVIPAGVVWVRGWDLAATEEMSGNDPDYTAGVKLGYHAPSRTYIIGHVIRDRETPQGVEKMLKNVAAIDGRDVPIFIPQDPGQQGKSQVVYLTQQLPGYTLKFNVMSKNKTDRASPVASQAEAGNVWVYRADWNADFFEEITAFPGGKHDDQVDALSSAFDMFVNETSGIYDFVKMMADQKKRDDDEMARAMGLIQHQDYQRLR